MEDMTIEEVEEIERTSWKRGEDPYREFLDSWPHHVDPPSWVWECTVSARQ
jgi:hypothetical protein